MSIFLFIMLLVVVVLALITGKIATGKKRSFALWAAISAVAAGLSTFLIFRMAVLGGSMDTDSQFEQLSVGGSSIFFGLAAQLVVLFVAVFLPKIGKVCPHCRETIDKYAKICPKCRGEQRKWGG